MALLRDKVVSLALSQVGYHEGANNWNKYAQELDAVYYFKPQYKQNVAWCNVFVDAMVYEACGKDKAKAYAALYQPSYDNLSAACKYAAGYFRKAGAWTKTAQVGAQIFFGSQGSETHTGIVVSVGVSTITTVEGNKNNAVCKCSYNKNASNIAGYGLIKYDDEPTPTPTKDEYTVKTNSGDSLRLRKEPNTSSVQTGYIPNGKTVKAQEVVEGESIGGVKAWIKTTYNGSTGYASGKYLTPTPEVSPAPTPPTPPEPTYKLYKVKTNSGDALRIREKPSTSSKQVGYIPNGETCKVYSITDGWATVTYNNVGGYAYARYLKEV